ncbi:RNA polymerase sigma factor [Chitinophaga sp. 22321]|uniref:Sigma-70 family RNA polymerase sigma factor n=1 Tax=Chitinophaga hostae TaxID=2831022 RepID=A0ABS5J7Q6_9BACT|nr:sigma-70 family RNA polymerase sigma factor [Chitinophaga hostae]MBS0031215.1 sigma-70 family RNA polymerase sigma factor [Chitinophaga hostae]
MHDNELWHSYKEGDVKALEGLYEQYYTPLTNYGFKFTPDNVCIEESMQDLFLKLWQNRERITRPTVVKQYLYLSFRRILLRKLEYNPSRHEEELAGEHIPFNLEFSYEHPLIRRERMADLTAKVEDLTYTLTNRQREAVFLKYYEDLSYEHIAEIMHMNAAGAVRLLYGALERLREQFGDFTLLLLLYILRNSR